MSMTATSLAVLDGRRAHFVTDDGAPVSRAYAITSLAQVLQTAQDMGWRQVWVLPYNGLPALFSGATLTEADTQGWTIKPSTSPGADLASWLYCWRSGVYGSIEVAQPRLDSRAPWGEAANARDLLLALRAYHRAVGYHVTYRRSPGATGTVLIRELHSGAHNTPLDAPQEPPPPASRDARGFDAPIDGVFDWIRDFTEEERHRAYLHAYDKNGMFLAACASLPLGYGACEHLHLCADEASNYWQATQGKACGYWRVSCSAGQVHACDGLIPGPLYDRRLAYASQQQKPLPDAVWVSTPTLAYLAPLWAATHDGEPPIIAEAYVWRQSRQALQPWYKTMRQARTALMAQETPAAALALRALKATYTQTIGWLGGRWQERGADPLYRPDWRHAIISQARANMLRTLAALAAAGTPPFAVGTDCLYFLSDNPDPVAACPPALTLGAGLGQWKVNASVSLSEPNLADALANPLPRRLRGLQRALNAQEGAPDGSL